MYIRDENAEEIVSKHIKLLHRYNEAKDATQVHLIASYILPVSHETVQLLMGKVS